MKRNNSKKWIKNVTIAIAVLVFGIGVGFAAKVAGTPNSDNDGAKTIVAAANDATDSVVKETIAQKETETDTETAAIEATTEVTTEEATEAVTERNSTIAETQPQTETATEAVQVIEHTEAATKAPVPVVQTPSDERVAQVISGINAERAAAGVSAVTYDAILTDMAQVRASENAVNDYFVIENGKHKRPDGRNASSI